MTAPGDLRPAGFMLMAVLLFSIWPALLDDEMSNSNPLLFNFALSAGRAIGVAVFLFVFFRRTFCTRRGLRQIYGVMNPWLSGAASTAPAQPDIRHYILLGIAAHFSHATFAFSTHFTDTAIATVIHELQPILTMFLLHRVFASGSAPARYRKISANAVVLASFALGGLTLLVIGTTKQVSGSGLASSSGLFGVLLALASALMAACNAYSMRWGAALYEAERGAVNGVERGRMEMGYMMFAYGLSSAVAAPLSLGAGLAAGAEVTSSLLVPAAAGCSIFVAAHAFQRRAFIETSNLSISALNYTTPLFALLWLAMFTEIVVQEPAMVIVGAALIIVANVLLNIAPERAPKTREKAPAKYPPY